MSTAQRSSVAGSFATSRRGGLSHEEVRMIEALRSKDRPEPWQALSARFGRPVEDIRAVVEAPRPIIQIQKTFQATDKPAVLLPGLWASGLPVDRIAEILQMDARSVARLRERLGLPPRSRGDAA